MEEVRKDRGREREKKAWKKREGREKILAKKTRERKDK
jgi:hypothetical protein